MARHLAGLGYPLLVHDLNARAVQSVVERGAGTLASAKAIASQARLVLTCLPSLGALQEVVLGHDGLSAGTAVKTYVDFSTTGAEFAREMAAALKRRNIMMLTAPITGNVITAGNGKLGIMCSGPEAAFRHAQPVMNALASTIVLYLGEDAGRAQTLKLLNNLLSATGMATSCEAFILGVKAGLDPEAMLEIVTATDASSSATRNKFARSVLPRQFDFGSRMAITAKDTSLTVTESEDLGVPMWVGQAVRQVWKYAASQGGAERDGTSLITYLEPWAGIEVRARERTAEQGTATPKVPIAITDFTIVCSQRSVPTIAARLRGQGWAVAIVEEDGPRKSSGKVNRICTLVGIADDEDAADAARRLLTTERGHRAIVNACLMASSSAATLAQQSRECGYSYVDALFTGTRGELESGQTGIIAGGPAAVLEAAKPLLNALGSRVFRISETPGAAHLMAQINASLFATLLAATCESYVTGAKAGLDPLTMARILGIETGRNAASAHIIPEQVATRKFNYGKTIREIVRALTLLSDEARERGVTTWILDKTRLLYGLAAHLGAPNDDVTRLITHYEKWSNTEVRAPAA